MKTNIKLIAIFSGILLLAACETGPSLKGDTNGDGVVDARDGVTPGTQSDLEANVGDRVLFAYDSSAVNAEGQKVLERQAAWLQNYPNVSVTVEGHTDERGTREYNLALGERRANAAKNYLVSLGVDAKRLSTVSYGKERPAVVGSDEGSWAQNRRAVSVVAN